MREFEQKRKVKRVLSSPIVLILFGIILLFLARSTWGIYVKDRDSTALLRSSESRLAELQDREHTLASSINKLQTESGIEAEIVDRFEMAKAGEQEVIIVETPAKQTAAVHQAPGFLQKIWDFFTIR